MSDTSLTEPTSQQAQRILVIEDDFAIRNSVEFALRRDGYEVRTLNSGETALSSVQDFAPDLILLDIMLPIKNGHEICEELRAIDQDIAIIMVSALGEADDRITGLRLGADDYVSKPFSLDELLERVRANLRRSSKNRSLALGNKDKAQTQKVLHFGGNKSGRNRANKGIDIDAVANTNKKSQGLLIIDPSKREVSINGQPITLRMKEFSLLYILASRAGEVLSRELLSEEVWGHDHLQSSRTIDVHMRRLRALLSKHGSPDYLKTVHGIGYRFDPSADLGDIS